MQAHTTHDPTIRHEHVRLVDEADGNGRHVCVGSGLHWLPGLVMVEQGCLWFMEGGGCMRFCMQEAEVVKWYSHFGLKFRLDGTHERLVSELFSLSMSQMATTPSDV